MRLYSYIMIHRLSNSLRRSVRSFRYLLLSLLTLTGMLGIVICIIAEYVIALSNRIPFKLKEPDPAGAQILMVSFLVFGIFGLALNASNNGGLRFELADYDFMFATPILPRAVLTSKLVSNFFTSTVLTTLFLTPFIWGAIGTFSNEPILPLGFITVLVFLVYMMLVNNLSFLFTTFGQTNVWWNDQGRRILSRVVWVPLLILFGWFALTFYRYGFTAQALHAITDSSVYRIVLSPVLWLANLLLAPVYGFGLAQGIELAFLIVLLIVSYLPLYANPHRLYEAAYNRTMAQNGRQEGPRSSVETEVKADTPFTRRLRQFSGFVFGKEKLYEEEVEAALSLPSFGEGSRALLWRSSLAAFRQWQRYAWFLGIGTCTLFFFLWRQSTSHATDATFVLGFLIVLTLPLQNYFSEDFTNTLKHADIMKALPIRSLRAVLVTLLIPFVTTSLMLYLSIAIIVVATAILGLHLNIRIIYLALFGIPFLVFDITAGRMFVNLLLPGGSSANRTDFFEARNAAALNSIIPGIFTLTIMVMTIVLFIMNVALPLIFLIYFLIFLFFTVPLLWLDTYFYSHFDPTD